jgi:hypothetical protein
VRGIPALFLFKDGQVVSNKIGAAPKAALLPPADGGGPVVGNPLVLNATTDFPKIALAGMVPFVVDAARSALSINAANLADEWAVFLRNYNTSGIPNTNIVKRIGAVLGVDAIIQGSVLSVSQKDSNGYDYPMTRVNVRYGAINAKTGALLWEISSEGAIQPYSYTAAPVIDAVRLAHGKILSSIPK